MGITYNSALNSNSKLAFTNRARVTFTLTGETDGGLAFGGSFRADNAGGAAGGTAGSVFISGDFGRIRMGDVDGAFTSLFGELAGVGLQSGSGLFAVHELDTVVDGGNFSLGTTALNAMLPNGSVFGAGGFVSQILTFDTTASAWTASGEDVRDALADLEFATLGDFDAATAAAALAPYYNATTDTYTSPINPGNTTNSVIQSAILAGFGTTLSDFQTDTGFTSQANAYNWTIASSFNAPAIEARVLYDYSIDAFSFALGYSQTGPNQAGSVAAAYTFDGLTVSAGYGQARWRDGFSTTITATGPIATPSPAVDGAGNALPTTASVSFTSTADLKAKEFNLGVKYTMDNLTAAAMYQDVRFDVGGQRIDKQRMFGASLAYTMDALTVTAFGKQTKSDLAAQNKHAYGIGAAYDLGGGASLRGGVINQRDFTGSSFNVADFGVAFRF